jgi:DNA-binding Xre family transcriptional regulator
MPKLKPSDKEKRRQQIKDNIDHALIDRHISKEDLWTSIGMSRSTFYDRLKQPDTIQIGELAHIARILNKTVLELLEGI